MSQIAFDLKSVYLKDHTALAAINDPNTLISKVLPNVYIIAGVLLLLYAVFGGFTIISSSGSPEGTSKGTQILTNAIIGFVIIFASYWIIQIIEVLTGVVILS